MSEHTWILENLAGYVAGGLEPAERERLEAHAAGCGPCGHALEEARRLDRSLESLFAGERPGPALEDRMIQSLRLAKKPRTFTSSRSFRVVAGMAAVLLLGFVGAGIAGLMGSGKLPFPGESMNGLFAAAGSRTVSFNNLKQIDLGSGWAEEAIGATDLHYSRTGEGRQGGQERGESAVNESAEGLAEATRERATASLKRMLAAEAGKPADERLKDGGVNGNVAGSVSQPWGASADGQGKEVARWNDNYYLQIPGQVQAGAGITLGNQVHSQLTLEGQQNLYYYKNYAPPVAAGGATPGGTTALGFGLAAGGRGTGAGGGLAGFGGSGAAPVPGMPPENNGPQFKPGDVFAEQKTEAKPAVTAPLKTLSDSNVAQNGGQGQVNPKPVVPVPNAGPRKIVIRSGDIEFEVNSFDPAVATITQLVNKIPGGFVDTVNSEKLANGKVRGSVVVRVPPESLDSLVLDLRKELGKQGELKGLKIGSQDITKQYTDLESRLRAARAMEERLLQIIKSGKGEIKDLLAAEKELGVWRTKIEEYEGELRHYQNLVALSTLTIVLAEKEIQAAVGIVETEQVQMGLEVEDVEKSQRAVLAAVAEAKGRVTKSELKQPSIGQFTALLEFEVAPASAGPLRDRLKQLGTVARLEVNRLRQTEGGTGKPADGKIRQNDTQFTVSLYNLTTVAPRDTVTINVTCADVEKVYKDVLARVEKATGRVVGSSLSRPRNDQMRGDLRVEVKAAEAEGLLQALKAAGEVMNLQVTESTDTQNTTRTKRGFTIQLWSLASIPPRETTTVKVAAKDVPTSYRALQAAVTKAKGRILNAKLDEQDKQNITGLVDFEVPRDEESAATAALAAAGDIFSRNTVRAPESENTVDSKVRWQVTLVNVTTLPPRETMVVGVEVNDVDQTATVLGALINQVHGRAVETHVSHERSGRVTARLTYDVPLKDAPTVVDKIKGTGTVRAQQLTRNPQAPEGDLATARIDVTLSNAELIVPQDDGVWHQVRKGLAWSFTALAWSLSWLIVALCVVLPWALLLWGAYRLVARWRPKAAVPS